MRVDRFANMKKKKFFCSKVLNIQGLQKQLSFNFVPKGPAGIARQGAPRATYARSDIKASYGLEAHDCQ